MKSPIDLIRERVENAYEESKNAGGNNLELIDMMFQEFMTVLEEIEVYEEELIEQNNELESQHYGLEKQRQRYEDLFEFAPEAYLVTDLHGLIHEANHMASQMLNINQEHLIGKPMVTIIEQNHRQRFRLILLTLESIVDFDMPVQPRNSGPIDAILRAAPVHNTRGELIEIRWALRDVSESKSLQAALRKSEERMSQVFASAPTAIILIDKDGSIQESNRALIDQLHYRPREIVHQSVERMILPEDWPIFKEQFDNLAHGRQDSNRFEVRFVDWNEKVHWMRVSLTRLNSSEGEKSGILLMTDDITAERQIAQERTEMRQRVMEGIENERVRLAQDLHDHPLQDLYGALFELVEVAEEQTDIESRQKLERVQMSMQQTIDSLRSTCGELRPPSLRFYGLEKAIRYYVELIKPRAQGMEFQLDLEKDDNQLPPTLTLALYRIIQQGLTNVIRHSQATQTAISMTFHDHLLTLKIEDNGVGFEMPDKMMEMVREGHYGLAGMRDRVESIGGKLSVELGPNRGTTVRIEVPVDEPG